MSREKQIEEMARDICENYNDDGTCYCDGKPCDLKCECFTDAQYFYEKGYRKQSKMLTEFLRMVENICKYEERLSYQVIEEGIKRQMAMKGGAE